MTARETNRVLQLAEQAQQIQEDTHVTVKSLDRFRKIVIKYWYIWLIIFGLVNGTAAIVAGFYHWDNKKDTKINTLSDANKNELHEFIQEYRMQKVKDSYDRRISKTQDSTANNQRLDSLASSIKRDVTSNVIHNIDGKFGVINDNQHIMNNRMNNIEKAIKLTNGFNEIKIDGIYYLKPIANKK